METHNDCKYLGNDAWNCGHIDNRSADEPCDCHVCTIRINRFSIYCGPTCVHTLAELLRNAGIPVEIEGTEHVYVRTYFTVNELFRAIRELPFGLNYSDITYLGKV